MGTSFQAAPLSTTGQVSPVRCGIPWAYPLLIALLLVFIVYQVYRLSYKVSFGLVVLTLFDVLVVWLTWREYRIKRRVRSPKVGAVA